MYRIIFLALVLTSCQPKEWKKLKTIQLNDVSPIGIAEMNGNLWISDSDNNQLLRINQKGDILDRFEGFERPMHIAAHNQAIYVPEYGSDTVTIFRDGTKTPLALEDSLDAPAGVAVIDEKIAVADFYNHRVLLKKEGKWQAVGKKGKEDGQFHYPTDVEFNDGKMYVADAYNHRVQVFDTEGHFIQLIGAEDSMNAATGIHISGDELFVTDFENDRLLIYSLTGELKQAILGFEKPVDALVHNNQLLVPNFKGSSISVLEKK